MLRNHTQRFQLLPRQALLNEVLSLNAQEWQRHKALQAFSLLLNEVLSLNAQECGT